MAERTAKGQFAVGHAKIGGRKAGVPDKRTQITRESARSSIELLSQAGYDPLTWQVEIASLMHNAAYQRALKGKTVPHDPKEASKAVVEAITNVSMGEARLVLDWLKACAETWHRMAQFRYPKLAQVDFKDAMMCEPAGGAVAGVVEYTRRIIVEPDGRQYIHEPRVIEQRPANGAGSRRAWPRST